MKKIILLLFCMPLLMASSCENSDDDDQIMCTLEVVSGLSVTVTDSQTNLPLVENVTVSATEGTYQEILELVPGSGNIFTGAHERTGNYTITVTKEGYQTNTFGPITVTKNVCHVITQQVQVVLIPN